jgi:hypothetical protein
MSGKHFIICKGGNRTAVLVGGFGSPEVAYSFLRGYKTEIISEARKIDGMAATYKYEVAEIKGRKIGLLNRIFGL